MPDKEFSNDLESAVDFLLECIGFALVMFLFIILGVLLSGWMPGYGG